MVNSKKYNTLSANQETVNKQWVLVDAKDEILGRLCSKIAKILRGKHKANFTPHVDCGDNVVVINADKIKLTAKKWSDKLYIRHTGYPGGQRILTAQEVFDKNPIKLIEKSVKGMLPKNKLGSVLYTNLKVYPGPEHNQVAQKPTEIDIKTFI